MQLFCEWYALYHLLQVCTSSDGKTPYPPAAMTGLVDLSTDGVLAKKHKSWWLLSKSIVTTAFNNNELKISVTIEIYPKNFP